MTASEAFDHGFQRPVIEGTDLANQQLAQKLRHLTDEHPIVVLDEDEQRENDQ